MASRFWVGGGSANTWAATGNTNWATTSGGSNNASVPTTTDVAIFDSNSGVSNSVIGASIAVQGLDCTGGTGNYAGTITHNTSVTLTINTGAATSLRFSAGMTYTAASSSALVTFTHTSGNASVTSNGKRLGALTVNGAGGTTLLVDALRVDVATSSVLTVTNGILDAGTNTAAITATAISSSNSNTRSLILGGLVKIGNATTNTTIWNTATTTGLTFTKNSANLEIVAQTSSAVQLSFAPGSLTFNDITLDTSSNQTMLAITSSLTCAHLAINPGWGLMVTSSSVLAVSNAFALAGTSANPIPIFSTGPNAVTISVASGACTLSWGALYGIAASGGATFVATNTLDCGANTNWSISRPADATVAAPTAAQIATAVWQDVTAADFTAANSVGLSLMNGVTLGLALHIATVDTLTTYTGNTPQTGDAFARIGALGAGLTAVVAASVTGSVGSVASYGTLVADTATAVWAAGTRSLTTFGTLVADVATAVWGAGTRTLTSLGTAVADVAAAVWTAVARTITGTVTLAATQTEYAPAQAGDAMTLTAAYDAAKTAATQTSVNAIPTTPLLAGSYTAPDNAGIGVAAAAAASAATDASAVRTTTDSLVMTGGKLWVLDAGGNAVAASSDVNDIKTRLGVPSDHGSGATVGDNFSDVFTSLGNLPGAVRDVSNSAPAAGSLGEAVRGADAKAAVLIDTIGAPAVTVSDDIAAIPTNVELATALAGADDATLAAIAALHNVAATDIVSDGAITTSGGVASANVEKVNGVTIVGDGNGTPFNV